MDGKSDLSEADIGRPAPLPRAAESRAATRTTLLALIALVVVGWALSATVAVTVPLVTSILVALAVMPVRDRVSAVMSPRYRWLGVAAAMAVVVLVVAVFVGALWLAARQVLQKFPAAGEMDSLPPQLGGAAGGGGSADAGMDALTPDSVADLAPRVGDAILDTLSSLGATILGSTASTLTALVAIFFLTLLILLESGEWRKKIAAITDRRDEWRLTESAEVIAHKLRVYLLIRATLGVITAVLYALWLWIFGVGLVLVWLILTFLLNFIPTVGSIIAGLLPTLYALLTKDFGTALAVGGGILVIEQVMGNFVDPKIAGSRVAVSPLVVLVALLLWSMIWGIPGALLAVPVTVSLLVLGAHVPALRPWALLLSDRTDMEGLAAATRPPANDA